MNRIFLLVLGFLSLTPLCAQELYDINTIQEVRIFFEEQDWDAKLDSFKQVGENERLVADVTINGTLYKDAGVRYKGNSSYFNTRKSGASKLPFNIKVDYKNKKQELPGGYETMKLSNVFRDPSFIREILAYEIAGQYMNAPKANFCKVYVNGKYLGLYHNSESVDDKFLDDNFGSDKGTFFKCDPNWSAREFSHCPVSDKASLMYLGHDSLCYLRLYEIKSKHGWSDLMDLAKILNKTPEKIETILDVNEALWMLAFNNVLVNLDSYSGRLCHNYYLYQDKTGVFHPIIWDMNLCLGGFRYTGLGSPLSNEKLQTLSPFVHYKQKNQKRPLITNLLSNGLYRKMYVAHVKTLLEENFSNGRYLIRAKEIQDMVDTEVQGDSNKLYTYDDFVANLDKSTKAGKSTIIGIRELMEKRSEYLTNHPLLQKEDPVISEVEHIDYETSLAVQARVEKAEKVWLFYRYEDEGRYMRLEMFDDSGHNDELEGDGLWGATLERKKGTQYYIVAEGEHSATLSPRRASKEVHVFE